MAKEYSRTQRVADHLQRELAALIQHEVRDPRVGMVNITGVSVSRDLGYAKAFTLCWIVTPAKMQPSLLKCSIRQRGFYVANCPATAVCADCPN